MSAAAAKGHCLCGACAFTAKTVAAALHICHCDMCRRWTGGPEYGVDCTGVTFAKDAPVARWRSSDWAERAFCGQCGSALFYRLIDAPAGEVSMPPGLFEDQTRFRIAEEIFIDERPAWSPPVSGAAQLTGAEALAAFRDGS